MAKTDNWTNNIKAMELHERGKHGVKMAPVAQPKEEQGNDAQEEKGDKKRQEKRAQAKLPLFEEVETREEFRRKTQEFYTYATRTNLKIEEQAEDLYSALTTSLKRRLLVSSRIDKVWKKTDPKVIIEEMEKVCLLPLNLGVERQEFRRLKQEKNKSINGYESRIRAKATLCSYNSCKCDKDCYATECGANREEDEILDLVLGSMKNKVLQKKIWRKGWSTTPWRRS